MSSNRAQKIFCEQMNNFSNYIKLTFKDDYDVNLMLSALDSMVNITPGLVIQFFKEYIVSPYEKQILERNVSFLKNELANSDIQNSPFGNIHHKITENWESLTEKQHNAIWDYFKILVLLCKKM